MRSFVLPSALAAAVAAALVLAPSEARADERLLIKYPGEHPNYFFEAEPQALIGVGGPLFDGASPFGVGFRGTFNLVHNGFVKSINNSVGLGVGIDAFFAKHETEVVIPVVLQWNFWLSTHWSVYGEPGVAFGTGDSKFQPFIFQAGGRYHFNERVALTLRAGYPSFSVGLSIFL